VAVLSRKIAIIITNASATHTDNTEPVAGKVAVRTARRSVRRPTYLPLKEKEERLLRKEGKWEGQCADSYLAEGA